MKKIDPSMMAFALFALLIALRDILFEILLTEDPISFAFFMCSTIFVLSITIVALQGGLLALYKKTMNPRLIKKVTLFGALSGGLYGLGFFLVSKMGAGLFNLVDYGFTPIATALVGVIAFRNKIKPSFFVAALVYLIGLTLILLEKNMDGLAFVGIAMALPVVTASTDGFMKWFLDPTGGNLSRSEVLVLRFFPAAAVLAIYKLVVDQSSIEIDHFGNSILVSCCVPLRVWTPLKINAGP